MITNRTMSYLGIVIAIGVLFSVNSTFAQDPQFEGMKKYLRPAVKNGGFVMDSCILWCSSVIKVDSTYHMFASCWPAKYGLGGWTTYSECVRATSNNLLGPYTFQEVVLQKRAGFWDSERVHNVKIVKAGSKYVLHYISTANETGYAEADSITGPWTRSSSRVISFSNPAPLVRSDGSVYVFGRYADAAGLHKGVACIAPSYKGPYTMVANWANLLPNNYELEDPCIWWANNQYNVLCTDWNSHATGIYKSGAQYYSKDGISYKLVSTEAVFDRNVPVVYDDGSNEKFVKRERPFVYVNEQGEAIALFTACLYNESVGPSKIVVQPIDHYYPIDLTTNAVESADLMSDGFHISEAFPNPFNPTTTIHYQLSKTSYMSLKVYDTLGREVALLVNEAKSPGSYTVQWTAANSPSGMYLARITARPMTDSSIGNPVQLNDQKEYFRKTIRLILLK